MRAAAQLAPISFAQHSQGSKSHRRKIHHDRPAAIAVEFCFVWSSDFWFRFFETFCPVALPVSTSLLRLTCKAAWKGPIERQEVRRISCGKSVISHEQRKEPSSTACVWALTFVLSLIFVGPVPRSVTTGIDCMTNVMTSSCRRCPPGENGLFYTCCAESELASHQLYILS